MAPSLVGGLALPVAGALPDTLIVLASGFHGAAARGGAHPRRELREQVDVGVGALVGSTVMLLTVVYGGSILAGRCAVDPRTGRAVDGAPPRLPPADEGSGPGQRLLRWLRRGAGDEEDDADARQQQQLGAAAADVECGPASEPLREALLLLREQPADGDGAEPAWRAQARLLGRRLGRLARRAALVLVVEPLLLLTSGAVSTDRRTPAAARVMVASTLLWLVAELPLLLPAMSARQHHHAAAEARADASSLASLLGALCCFAALAAYCLSHALRPHSDEAEAAAAAAQSGPARHYYLTAHRHALRVRAVRSFAWAAGSRHGGLVDASGAVRPEATLALFRRFDRDRSGAIDAAELRALITGLEIARPGLAGAAAPPDAPPTLLPPSLLRLARRGVAGASSTGALADKGGHSNGAGGGGGILGGGGGGLAGGGGGGGAAGWSDDPFAASASAAAFEKALGHPLLTDAELDAHARAWMREFDRDRSGAIDYCEFHAGVERWVAYKRRAYRRRALEQGGAAAAAPAPEAAAALAAAKSASGGGAASPPPSGSPVSQTLGPSAGAEAADDLPRQAEHVATAAAAAAAKGKKDPGGKAARREAKRRALDPVGAETAALAALEGADADPAAMAIPSLRRASSSSGARGGAAGAAAGATASLTAALLRQCAEGAKEGQDEEDLGRNGALCFEKDDGDDEEKEAQEQARQQQQQRQQQEQRPSAANNAGNGNDDGGGLCLVLSPSSRGSSDAAGHARHGDALASANGNGHGHVGNHSDNSAGSLLFPLPAAAKASGPAAAPLPVTPSSSAGGGGAGAAGASLPSSSSSGGGGDRQGAGAPAAEPRPLWAALCLSALWFAAGTALCAAFAGPLVNSLGDLASATGVPAFTLSFFFAPLASNASELVSSLRFASGRRASRISATFAQVYGAVVMNHTMVLGALLAVVHAKGLPMRYGAEAAVMALPTLCVGVLGATRETVRAWVALPLLAMYPAVLGLQYALRSGPRGAE